MNNGFRSIAIVTSLLVAGCGGGGGGGGSAPAGTAEGFWEGTTGNGRTVWGVVLQDGTSWFIYSGIGNDNVIAGVIQGSSTSIDGNYSSSNARDFNLEGWGVLDGTISGNYAQMQTLDGSATSSAGSTIFNLDYDNDYDLTPSLVMIAGTYVGEDFATKDPATVTIAADGSMTSISTGGCQATGTVTPNPNGNIYDVVVTFLGGTCANGTSTVTGVLVGDGTGLVSAALNVSRTNGFLYLGTRT
ncbi:MAG: hypothetical protein FJ170_03085 [Gammaproteobacteria bacterium]|nr:hypothetical protein [Gammaproteobacteria bacterium]